MEVIAPVCNLLSLLLWSYFLEACFCRAWDISPVPWYCGLQWLHLLCHWHWRVHYCVRLLTNNSTFTSWSIQYFLLDNAQAKYWDHLPLTSFFSRVEPFLQVTSTKSQFSIIKDVSQIQTFEKQDEGRHGTDLLLPGYVLQQPKTWLYVHCSAMHVDCRVA